MTVQQYFQSLRASGTSLPPYSSQSGGSEILTFCKNPECKQKDKPTLYINNYSGAYTCHRCGIKGVLKPFMKNTQESPQDLVPNERPSGRLDSSYIEALALELSLEINAKAQAYLVNRALTDETIKAFKLGYCRDKDAISIPNLDFNGEAVSIKYRHLNENADAKYTQEALGGRAQLPYGLWRLKEPRTGNLYICEGELDAISLSQLYPEESILALPGKNSFPKNIREDSEGILAYLSGYKSIYLYPDREVRATLDFTRHAGVLGKSRCTLIRLPAGIKDINDGIVKGMGRVDFDTLKRIATGGESSIAYVCAADVLEESIKVLREEISQAKYSSGISQIDSAMVGIRGGELTLLGGDGGCGKTTLATQIMYDVMQQRVPGLMGSYEMDIRKGIVPRMLSLAEGTNLYNVASKDLNIKNYAFFHSMFFLSKNLTDPKVDIVAAHLEETYIQQKLTAAPLVIAVIDNLTKFRAPADTKGTDYIKFEEDQIQKMKDWTVKFPNLHLIVLVHFSKSADNVMNKNRIRGSAVIGATAENVILMSKVSEGKSKLVFDKVRHLASRNGAIVQLEYDSTTTRFKALAKDEQEF